MGCHPSHPKKKKSLVIDESIADTMEKYCLKLKQVRQLWKLFDKADVE